MKEKTVRELADAHIRRLREAVGEDSLTPLLEAQVERAGELLGMAARLRAKAIDGSAIELVELTRVETLAEAAVAALGIGSRIADKHHDFSVLDDDEIDQLEALLGKCVAAGPIPADGTVEAINGRLEKDVSYWKTESESLEGQLRSEQQLVVIRDGQIVRLRIEVDELRSALEALRNPKPPPVPPSPSNIVPLRTADTLTAPIFG
jgi:hypothetical protein